MIGYQSREMGKFWAMERNCGRRQCSQHKDKWGSEAPPPGFKRVKYEPRTGGRIFQLLLNLPTQVFEQVSKFGKNFASMTSEVTILAKKEEVNTAAIHNMKIKEINDVALYWRLSFCFSPLLFLYLTFDLQETMILISSIEWSYLQCMSPFVFHRLQVFIFNERSIIQDMLRVTRVYSYFQCKNWQAQS